MISDENSEKTDISDIKAKAGTVKRTQTVIILFSIVVMMVLIISELTRKE